MRSIQEISHVAGRSREVQMEHLISLGLNFKDQEEAKEVLKNISYFRLIEGYSDTFKEKGRYKEGVYFEDILDLYEFDQEFRHLIFFIIEKLDMKLRACISNYFARKYGAWGDPAEGKEAVYEEILVDGTFEALSRMIQNLKKEEKVEIESILKIQENYLDSWIQDFSFLRNICAHCGRIYSNEFGIKQKLYQQYENIVNKNTIFASILNLGHILKNKDYHIFLDSLEKLFQEYPKVNIQYMGFPENWKEILKKIK